MQNINITKDVLHKYLTLGESELKYLAEGKCIFSGRNIDYSKKNYAIKVVIDEDGQYRPTLFPFALDDNGIYTHDIPTEQLQGLSDEGIYGNIHWETFESLIEDKGLKMREEEKQSIIEFFSLDKYLNAMQIESPEGTRQIERLYRIATSVVQYRKLDKQFEEIAELQQSPKARQLIKEQVNKIEQSVLQRVFGVGSPKERTLSDTVDDINSVIMGLSSVQEKLACHSGTMSEARTIELIILELYNIMDNTSRIQKNIYEQVKI